MMKRFLPIAAAASAALIMAGCASTQPPQEPLPEPIQLVDTSVPNLRVTYADEQVAQCVKVMTARVVKKGQFPKVAFQLVNFTQAKFPIEYKIQWVDEDGAPLQSTAPWLQTTLSGSEAKPISSLGKSVEAFAALVTIRFPTSVEIYVPTPDPVEQMRIERQVIDDYNARLAAGQVQWQE